jgi:hypothetical protein
VTLTGQKRTFVTVATHRLFARYRAARVEFRMFDTAILILGTLSGVAGLATSLRILYGLAEGVPR